MPSSVMLPLDGLLQAGERLGELGLPVALDARDHEHLAAADGERHVVDEHGAARVGDLEVAHDERGLAVARGGSLWTVELDGAADHERGELGVASRRARPRPRSRRDARP